MKFEKPEIFICDCNSLEHTFSFWYDDETNDVHIMPRLKNYKNIFQRIIGAVKYILGHKSKYGDFDSFIIDPNDAVKIRKYLDRSELSMLYRKDRSIQGLGIDVFGDIDKFERWLLSTTFISMRNCNGRVMDMGIKLIKQELGTIDSGSF